MNNSKRIAIWLPRVALITALAALVFALAVPAYVQWEHNQVLKRQIEWGAQAAVQRNAPATYGCANGHYRVNAFIGAFQSSIPIWSEEGVVKCEPNGFTVNGEPVTESEVYGLAAAALNSSRESRQRRNDGDGNPSMPTFDAALIMQSLDDALAKNDLSISERKRLKTLRDELQAN